MKRVIRIVATVSLVSLVSLATTLVYWIVSIYGWGGQVKTLLLVFGDRVWVTFDAGRPRVFLLMIVPALLFFGAYSLARRWRDE